MRRGNALAASKRDAMRLLPAIAAWQRARRKLVRLPHEVLTFLLTQQTTRPVADLRDRVTRGGFENVTEERLHHDGFAIVTATPKDDP